ncbi:S9 family peptidase [Paludisphaera mucosa]|uniref:S9 family peptidase n=1 Tax=Paludisphaera mucosa TaxID=3030827 RepID=A0ABT6FEY2_9BACT|nr:S9 family peptidase [Paludisphaera mucosa]MDG3006049.1 S9 family peptidase [Paludisphaera mucosa]
MHRAAPFFVAVLALGTFATAQEPTIPVPETIRAEGVPAIPRSIASALNRYQNIRTATFQGWDEDKPRAVYITTRFADTMQVHHVAAPGAARRQLTFLPERVLGASPRPRRDQFLFTMDEGGAENYQLFLQDRAGGEPVRLSDGKSRHASPKWSPSGELLAWSSNARNGKDMDLYVASPADPAFRRLLKEVSGQWTVADWSPDGKRVAVEEAVSINESYVHLVDVATGAVETITPRPAADAPKVAVGGPRWSKDGKAIFYTSDKGNESRRLARYDLETGAETWLTQGVPWDVEEFDLSDDGMRVVAVTNEDGQSVPHVYQTATGAEIGNPSPPVGRLSGVEFRPDAHEIGFTLDSAQASSDVFSIDLAQRPGNGAVGPLERWTESETGGLDVSTFVSPELIHYRSFDGKTIPAFVYRPAAKSAGPRPVLIQIHGGPEAQFRPGFMGRLNYLINELGIVLIEPNVRGSDGYGKSYLKLDDGFLREDPVKDVGSLLDWVASQPDLDKSRVAVAGGSYGGFMSLAVQTTYNDRIKCGIDVVGISNFVTFLQNTQGYRRDLRRAEYGDERDPKMREFLERVSPLKNADKIKTPILVVQGANDPRVPLSESEQLVAAVKKNGVPVWYVVGKNEGHGFAKKSNQDYQQAVEVLFLKSFLLGEPGAGK